jgi:hypothetical protein
VCCVVCVQVSGRGEGGAAMLRGEGRQTGPSHPPLDPRILQGNHTTTQIIDGLSSYTHLDGGEMVADLSCL